MSNKNFYQKQFGVKAKPKTETLTNNAWRKMIDEQNKEEKATKQRNSKEPKSGSADFKAIKQDFSKRKKEKAFTEKIENKRTGTSRFEDRPKRAYGERAFDKKDSGDYKPRERTNYGDKPRFDAPKRAYGEKTFDKKDGGDYKPRERKDYGDKPSFDKPKRAYGERTFDDRKPSGYRGKQEPMVKDVYEKDGEFTSSRNKFSERKEAKDKADAQQMPLNKYLSHGGVSGRREAAEIIKAGKVRVNNKVMTTPGYKVEEGDVVIYDGKKITPQGNLVYLLLNKPKDFITTSTDPEGRKTVMDLVANACEERVYPVGRLDRNTSGLLLLTNDGELANKLSHPKYKVKKVYQVNLDKPLTKTDYTKIIEGLELEDGKTEVDDLAYIDANDKTKMGIQIHSGKNRVVRRIFESLGYVVKQLDRVVYANLTKKNLNRGSWRFLTQAEVKFLKFYNSNQ